MYERDALAVRRPFRPLAGEVSFLQKIPLPGIQERSQSPQSHSKSLVSSTLKMEVPQNSQRFVQFLYSQSGHIPREQCAHFSWSSLMFLPHTLQALCSLMAQKTQSFLSSERLLQVSQKDRRQVAHELLPSGRGSGGSTVLLQPVQVILARRSCSCVRLNKARKRSHQCRLWSRTSNLPTHRIELESTYMSVSSGFLLLCNSRPQYDQMYNVNKQPSKDSLDVVFQHFDRTIHSGVHSPLPVTAGYADQLKCE